MMEWWTGVSLDTLLPALEWLYDRTGSRGLAILALALGTRLALLPLNAFLLRDDRRLDPLREEARAIARGHASSVPEMARAHEALYRRHGLMPQGATPPGHAPFESLATFGFVIVQAVMTFALYAVLKADSSFSEPFLWLPSLTDTPGAPVASVAVVLILTAIVGGWFGVARTPGTTPAYAFFWSVWAGLLYFLPAGVALYWLGIALCDLGQKLLTWRALRLRGPWELGGIVAGLAVAAGLYVATRSPVLAAALGWLTFETVWPRTAGLLTARHRREQLLYSWLPRLALGGLAFLAAVGLGQGLPTAAVAALIGAQAGDLLARLLGPRLARETTLKARLVERTLRGQAREAAALDEQLRVYRLDEYRQTVAAAEKILETDPAAAQQALEGVTARLDAIPDRTPVERAIWAQAQYGLGRLHRAAGRFDDAITCLRHAYEYGITDSARELAVLLARLGLTDDASLRTYTDYLRLRRGQPRTADDLLVLRILESALAIQHDDPRDTLTEIRNLAGAVVDADPSIAWAHYTLGVACRRLGDVQQAERHLQEAVRLDSDRADAHYQLGRCLEHRRAFAEARACYVEALDLDGRHGGAAFRLAALLLYELTDDAVRAGGQTRAIERIIGLLEQAAPQDAPESARAYLLGRAYLLLGMATGNILVHTERARAHLERCLAADPRHVEGLYEHARACRALSDQPAAIRSLDRALAIDVEHLPSRRLLGELYIEEGRFDLAVVHFQAVVRSGYGDGRMRAELGRALFELGRFAEAVDALEPAAEEQRDALYYLGRACARLGQLERAVTTYRTLLNRYGADADALYYLACAVAAIGLQGDSSSLTLALTYLSGVLATNPRYWQAHVQAGHICLSLDRLHDAYQHYQQAYALQPGHADILYGLGRVAYSSGDHAVARTAFEQAVAADSEHAPSQIALATLAEVAGDLPAALAAYRAANAFARHGVLACKLGDFAAARESLTRARASGDHSDAVLSYLGHALAACGEHAAALEPWETLLARHPDDRQLARNVARLIYLVGLHHLEDGQLVAAAQAWERYVAMPEADTQAHHDLAEVYFRLGATVLTEHLQTMLSGARNGQARNGSAANGHAELSADAAVRGNGRVREPFIRALHLAAGTDRYLYHLALAELADGEDGTAVDRLQALRAADPTDAVYALHLGLALYNTGHHDAARGHLQAAVTLGAGGPVEARARWALAALAVRERRWTDAVELFRAAATA